MTTLLQTRTEPFDHAAATREGWDVFHCDTHPDGERQLQRVDAPENGAPPFPDDRTAWEFVVTRARAGSVLHQAALAAVDDTERMLIEAACGAW